MWKWDLYRLYKDVFK